MEKPLTENPLPASVPDDWLSVALPSTVLCRSAGVSFVKQAHYPRWLPHRQEGGGGDAKRELMIRSVQLKLAPLITPLIGQGQKALLARPHCLFRKMPL